MIRKLVVAALLGLALVGTALRTVRADDDPPPDPPPIAYWCTPDDCNG